MPPKIKVTKENIINCAVEIVRQKGASSLNARNIATALECSTQPIFSNFATMNELYYEVVTAADRLYEEYTEREVNSNKYPVYKATGMAYICFAKQEKELFKLLFMRDRTTEVISPFSEELSTLVQNTTGLNPISAEMFHLEMWAYVHGIATMMATDYLELNTELVSEMITDAYQGLKFRFESKE